MLNMISNILEFISMFLKELYIYSLEYKFISLSLLIILLLIISSFSFNSKITLKRNKKIWHLKTSKILTEYINKNKYLKEKRDVLARDIAFITQKNSKTNKDFANSIIYIFFIIAILVVIISAIFVKYTILKLIIPVLVITLIVLIFNFEINKRRKIAKKDFGRVIKVFTTKYSKSNNILQSFNDSIEDIPNSHKYEFNRLISSMGSATKYINALDEYALRIDDLMCYLFVEILKIGMKRNDYILYALIELENDIAKDKKAEKIKNNKLNDKKLNIYLGIFCIFGAYLIDIGLLGDYAKNLYFSTFAGQVFIMIATVIITIILLCINILNRLL